MKKKYISVLLILLLAFNCCILSACTTSDDDTKNVEGTNNYKMSEEEISALDFNSVYDLSCDFLEDYYLAVMSNDETFDIEAYINNDNLISYVESKKENAKVQSTEVSISNGAVEIEWHDDYVFIEIQSAITETESKYNSSVGERNQLIITPQNGRYFISDWYSKGTVSFDEIIRGEVKKISDPNIWDNHSYVNEVNKKINAL